jgi:hypothetical protein
VSNVENSTTQHLAQRVKILLQNEVSVEEHIPQTTEAVNIINLTRSRNATQKPQVSNFKYNVASVSQPVTPPLNTQPITPPRATRTSADVTRGGNDNNQDITLSTFLEEFKQMFHQLIQQNS